MVAWRLLLMRPRASMDCFGPKYIQRKQVYIKAKPMMRVYSINLAGQTAFWEKGSGDTLLAK